MYLAVTCQQPMFLVVSEDVLLSLRVVFKTQIIFCILHVKIACTNFKDMASKRGVRTGGEHTFKKVHFVIAYLKHKQRQNLSFY